MDRVDVNLRRHARLQFAVVPPMELLESFLPDEDGRVEEIGRDEAEERGLKYYVSRRLCPLDKILETRERMAVVVRLTESGLSLGEQALAERATVSRQGSLDAAVRRATLARVAGDRWR